MNAYARIWDELEPNYFFDDRQKKESQISFKVKDITSLFVYLRLLNPCSKKRTFDHRDRFLGLKGVEQEHICRALPFLAEQQDNPEKHLNRQPGLKMHRNLSITFYDVTPTALSPWTPVRSRSLATPRTTRSTRCR